MSSTSTQTVEIPDKKHREEHPSSSGQPLAEPKTNKRRFSITIVGGVPF
jgi:hypothetical protein